MRTASQLAAAICLQSTHHCGRMSGSMTSLLRLQRPSDILLSAIPRNSPLPSRNSVIVLRTCNENEMWFSD